MNVPDASNAAHSGLNVSPFCTHLQSKKNYFRSTPAMEEDDYLDASRHCWCRLTMQAMGPDKERAAPDDCRSGRACFRGIL
ncbi:MAG: hypothetical protein SGI72_13875 [Planctomycetota bacterium]|nr:hypothetical protein [Planctomycetota bacterium]